MPIYRVFVGIIDKEFVVEAENTAEAGKSVREMLTEEEVGRLRNHFVYMRFRETEKEELD